MAIILVRKETKVFKIFGKFQSKKQLRIENERLKRLLLRPPEIHEVERNIQIVQSCYDTTPYERDIPEEYFKNQIAKEMIKFLKPLIEYDITDNEYGGKTYRGKLHVADRK